MIKNIAHIKFRDSNIGKFEHLHIKDIKVFESINKVFLFIEDLLISSKELKATDIFNSFFKFL